MSPDDLTIHTVLAGKVRLPVQIVHRDLNPYIPCNEHIQTEKGFAVRIVLRIESTNHQSPLYNSYKSNN